MVPAFAVRPQLMAHKFFLKNILTLLLSFLHYYIIGSILRTRVFSSLAVFPLFIVPYIFLHFSVLSVQNVESFRVQKESQTEEFQRAVACRIQIRFVTGSTEREGQKKNIAKKKNVGRNKKLLGIRKWARKSQNSILRS